MTSPPQVAYRETIAPAGRLQLHAQEADRRLGPVRQGRRLHRALRGRRLRVRRRDRGRRDPARVHPVVREGLPARCSRRARCIGFPVVGVRVVHQRRRSRTRSTRRTSRSRRPRAAPCARPTTRAKPEDPRADHEGRRSRARPSSRATSWRTLMQRRGIIIGSPGGRRARARRGRGAARRDVRLLDRRCARRRRARPSSRWSSRATSPSRRPSPRSWCRARRQAKARQRREPAGQEVR